MDEKELVKLIEKGETERVEFKESLSDWKEIVKTISAFDNAKGGTVLIGITDEGKTKGLQTGRKTLEDLANKIKENTDPKNYPKIRMEDISKKKIIVIEAEESKFKPVFAFDGVYKRVGKTNQRISSEEIREMARESGKVYWDGQICKEAVFEDVDEERIKKFLRKAKYERNFNIDPETPAKEALERLELIKNEKLTNGAILLFGKNPQKFFLQAEVRCARFKGIEPIEFIDMKVFGGNIISQRDDAIEFIKEHIKLHMKIAGAERIEKWEYPIEAIREAVTNAICHRDYEVSSNIQIRIFDDRIETWGCGLLPKPLTAEDLKKKHKSILRNPLIAKYFFLVKFIEEWGTGTNRIVEECLKHGLPEPLFEEVVGSFVITFRKDIITEDYLKNSGLIERQIKAVVFMKKKGKITNKIYRDLTDLSDEGVRKDLIFLLEKGLIKSVGKGRGVYYILK